MRPLADDAIADRLAACARQLNRFAPLWRTIAFRNPGLAWESEFPRLAAALRGMSLQESDALQCDPQAAHAWLAAWLPLEEVARVEDAGAWPGVALRPWPRGFASTVPGRKWHQLEAFLGAVPMAAPAGVDWCAGKGHLARAASWQWQGSRFVALERDARLVAAGEHLARRAGVAIDFHVCDVLHHAAIDLLTSTAHVLALHACGALHQRLLRVAVARGVAALSCAPCCYHLMSADDRLVLSRAGSGSPPPLAIDDLRTAVQETVTAPGHARRRRQHVQQWQLGFDLLQRELRGVDEYLPQPAQPTSVLSQGFAAYCRLIAANKGIEIPAAIELAAYERAGEERFRQVNALDLVRHRFRRLLELWLVLDRAQFLVEAGYRVAVGTFCRREVSPRNLLIDARLC